jgi:hypothetical protein
MTTNMTVGELIERLHQFDDDLPVVMDGDLSTNKLLGGGFRPMPNLTPVLYAELPSHERHVVLTASVYPDGELP